MSSRPVPIAELVSICGPERVITEHAALRTYESDGLLQYAVVPAAAVLPDTAEEVAAVVAACHRAGVPWVARGSGTGLSGGSLPVEGGVVISLSRMRRILDVDLANQRIVVEPGVTNAQISAAVGPTHFYPPDPSSQIICSIGGNVAENSGGVHCFKYGFTTNWVVGCEVVLPDGSITVLGGVGGELDRPGYDLLGTFVGSEGTLGCGHEDHRCGSRRPRRRPARWWPTSTRRSRRARSSPTSCRPGVVPGAMEIMDNLAIAATEAATGAGNPLDAGALLIVELDGSESECAARFDEVVRFCEANGATGVRIAADRGRAGPDLEGPQGRLRRHGPHLAQLLRAGRGDPPHPPPPGAAPHRGARRRVRAAGGQRLPRRRRQPAPAGALRRRRRPARPNGPRSWPAGSSRSAWRKAVR